MSLVIDKFKESELEKDDFPCGQKNSITDVPGVRVGNFTFNRDIITESSHKACVRTGLTAILPYPMEKSIRLFAGSFILRGRNEATGFEVMDDFRYLNSPIVLVNPFNVGRVYNAILSYGFSLGRDEIWPPVVISINDSYLNEMKYALLSEDEILETLRNASTKKMEEGCVGVGLGLRAFDRKGGIGSSSRLITFDEESFVLGIVVASNHANSAPKASFHSQIELAQNEEDSLTIVVGCDIPLIPYQIDELTRNLVCALSPLHTSSSSHATIMCIFFTVANPMSMENEGPEIFEYRVIDDEYLGKILRASLSAFDEAFANSLLKATSLKGRLGREVKKMSEDEFQMRFRARKGENNA